MKTLILYTTKYGSVQKASEILGGHFGNDVTIINLKEGDNMPNLLDFDTIIIGGSIYMGTVQKELKSFVHEHLDDLLTKNVGLFLCAGEKNEKKSEEQFKNSFPISLYTHAKSKEIFGDAVSLEKVNFFEKLALRLLKGVTESYSNLSDEKIEKLAHDMKKHFEI